MKQPLYLLAIAILAFSGSAATAQENPATPSERQWQEVVRDPISALLARSEPLGLSGDQISRLEQIRTDLESRNAPLVAQLGELQPSRRSEADRRPGSRRAGMDDATREEMRQRRAEMVQQREALAPVLQELRENNRSAMNEAVAVLSEEQREYLRSTVLAGREHRGARRGPEVRDRQRIRRGM